MSEAKKCPSPPGDEQIAEHAMLTSTDMCCDCRVPRKVSRAGGVSAELGRGLRHLHHAGDWSAAATSSGGL